MDGPNNIHQQDFRYISEDDVQRDENDFRLVEHSQQCCNKPLHRRLKIPSRRSQCPQLKPANVNIPRCPSPSTIIHNSSLSMERTPSGHSILSGTALSVSSKDEYTLSDAAAAKEMTNSFRRRRRHLFEERVLASLLRSGAKLDNEALDSVLCATDKVFFHGQLAGRVRWEWSHPDATRYEHELIGTTALRKAKNRSGYETLIILSRPMLWSGKYNHRLLLSTFLHEAVHCYLFIRCGFKAIRDGGHTDGFRAIAKVIDRWADGLLQLRNTKADLNSFSVGRDTMTSSSTSDSDSTSPITSSTAAISSISLESQNRSLIDITDPNRVPTTSAEQRIPRIDRARYMRAAAELSYLHSQFHSQQVVDGNTNGNGNTAQRARDGWSSFVAFTGGAPPG